MGLFDDVGDKLADIDFDEPHLWGHGFDPGVCEGCPAHETDGPGPNTCGQCGCPTSAMAPMNLADAPPESCLRLPEHADGEEA